MGCMATKEIVRTERRRLNKTQRRRWEWVLYLFLTMSSCNFGVVATGSINFSAFPAACLLCFSIFRKNVVCINWLKNIGKMPLTRQQRRGISIRRARRIFFLFMLWRMYSANTRAFWVHPLFEERRKKGEFYMLYPDLRHFPPKFFAMYRMNPRKFDHLLSLVGPHLEKQWTNMRSPISSEQKLVVTLRWAIILIINWNEQETSFKCTKLLF